jgi:phosphatidate cytidylyltransferase
MTDDRNNDQSNGGFDDWLDDDPGPVTDPYKISASEVEDDPDTLPDDADGVAAEVASDAVEVETSEEANVPNSGDETAEIDVAPDATSVPEDGEVIQEDDEVDETAEIDVAATADPSGTADTIDADEPDDTGELEIMQPQKASAAGFEELGDDSGDQDPDSDAVSPEFFDITEESYLHTATKEHEGLAESIAIADEEDTAQVALAAPIPGLDSTVVGFEDVVEAEGYGRVRARASGDLVARVITAIVLIAALGAALLWQPALVALALGIFLLGAGEFYTALLRSGRKPIALFGFVGITAAGLGAYFGSALWIPIAFVLILTALLLFYAVVPNKVDPLANLGLTITVMVWAGLGTYAMLIARADAYRTLVLGVVVTVAAMDIAQYFFGRALGRHQLSPWVSPKKTIEGLVAGIVVALTIGALLHFFPPFELTSGLAIGAAVAVFAPMGDLAMSAAKRSLGLKDMGSVLPGHGGFLDRIDGLLFVIPAAWAIFLWAGIL